MREEEREEERERVSESDGCADGETKRQGRRNSEASELDDDTLTRYDGKKAQ